jgi:hypothetical protein
MCVPTHRIRWRIYVTKIVSHVHMML